MFRSIIYHVSHLRGTNVLSIDCQTSAKLFQKLQQIISSLDIDHCYHNMIVNIFTELAKLQEENIYKIT